MSIDLEDWFHVTNFENYLNRRSWESYPSSLLSGTSKLLDLFAKYEVRATFFSLGWVARHYPGLIKRIQAAGHELASHGDEHRLVTKQSPREFRDQLVKSKDILEQIAGVKISGHRAPSYSLRHSTKWAFQILLECGFEYDSSVFPFGSRQDPQLCDARFPCFLKDRGQGILIEYPLSTLRVFNFNVPIAGGGYFRFLPLPMVTWGIRKLNQMGQPAIMYLHPWELDPGQPRVQEASWLKKFRHYYGLEKTEEKLERLLASFSFSSFRDVFWSPHTNRYEIIPQNSIYQD